MHLYNLTDETQLFLKGLNNNALKHQAFEILFLKRNLLLKKQVPLEILTDIIFDPNFIEEKINLIMFESKNSQDINETALTNLNLTKQAQQFLKENSKLAEFKLKIENLLIIKKKCIDLKLKKHVFKNLSVLLEENNYNYLINEVLKTQKDKIISIITLLELNNKSKCFSELNVLKFKKCANIKNTIDLDELQNDMMRGLANKDFNFSDFAFLRNRDNDPHNLYSWYAYILYFMLISCKFNNLKCDQSNFTMEWHNQYGLFFTFNINVSSINYNYRDTRMKPMRSASQTGPKYGLHLELAVCKIIHFN